MLATLITAVLCFVSTNIDDIFVLMVLFAQVHDRRQDLQVMVGQFCGIAVLTALGVAGALGTRLLPTQCVGLLGLVPLLLGIRAWIGYRRGQGEDASEDAGVSTITVPSVALITIANGGDNVGVYIPAFSGFGPADLVATAATFAVLTALWCWLGHFLANRPLVRRTITRYQQVLVPLVLVCLGVAILARAYL